MLKYASLNSQLSPMKYSAYTQHHNLKQKDKVGIITPVQKKYYLLNWYWTGYFFTKR
jgi:hypothetical protein